MNHFSNRKLAKHKKALLAAAIGVGFMTSPSFVAAEAQEKPYLDVIDLSYDGKHMAELLFLAISLKKYIGNILLASHPRTLLVNYQRRGLPPEMAVVGAIAALGIS